MIIPICASVFLSLQFSESTGMKNSSVFGSANYYNIDKTFANSELNSSKSTITVVALYALGLAAVNAVTLVAAEMAAAEAAEAVAAAGLVDIFAIAADVAAVSAIGIVNSNDFNNVKQNIAMATLD